MNQPIKLFAKLSILSILGIFISSCTTDEDPHTFSKINTFPFDVGYISEESSEESEEEESITIPVADSLLIDVGYNPEICEKLPISCPGGVICDENYLYRAYLFQNSRIYFYISFDPSIIGDFSLESIREKFNYLNFGIYFPERETTNSKFLYSHRGPIRQLNQTSDDNVEFTIDSYENGSIKGVIKGTIRKITESIQSNSPDCSTGDILGMCSKSEIANTPFEIKYNFCFTN